MKHFPAKHKFVYLCSVFRWWCRHVTSYQCDPELPILFLARLCAAIENVVASGTIKMDDMKSESLDTKEKSLGNGMVTSKKVEIDAKLSGLYLNAEKSNLENCMSEVTRKQINSESPSEVIRLSTTCAGSTSENKGIATLNDTVTSDSLPSVTSNPISDNKLTVNPCEGNVIKDIKSEIEQLMWSVVKYVPTNHLTASVANKLKKLYEVGV